MTKTDRTIVLGLAVTLLSLAGPVLAAPPPNDDFDRAIAVGALPFYDTQEATEATGAPDDPGSTCGLLPPYTIWYTFTPAADAALEASASYVSSVHVYTGPRGALTQVACGGFSSPVRFQALAGTTYHLMVVVGVTPPVPALVTFSLQEVAPPPPPPVNDEIADATLVPSLPFSESVNTVSATSSPDDPSCYGSAATIWYALTAASEVRVQVDASGGWYSSPAISVSTGAPGSLQQIACQAFNGPQGARVRFDATAGVTYWIMIGSVFGRSGGPMVISLSEAPPPFSLGVQVDPRGSVVPTTGTATVRGTVTCSEPAFVDVSGSLRQERPGGTLEAWFWMSVLCDGMTSWSATPYYGLRLFRGRSALLYTAGRAEAQVTASGTGMTTGDYDEESATRKVVLAGSK